ncbi:MFS transporter, partial [Intestinibacillus massiliensis]|nr:MFS transporter [Intestinibacillus massiliensis]
MTQKDVEHYLNLRSSTVTHILARAEENGLITREKSLKDSRAKHLSVTPKGQNLIPVFFSVLDSIENKMTAGMNEEERQLLKRLLSQAADNLTDEKGSKGDVILKDKSQSMAGHSAVTRRDILVIGIVVAGAFIAILNQTVLSPALPKLMEDFQITAGTAQWVTTIYMLVNGIMVPVTGFLIDRFSTRKLFIGSMCIFMVGTLVCAAAPSFAVLTAARVLQAMGAGIQLPLVAYVP